MPTQPLDVLVIGGGQAGLAMGHHLAQRGLRFEILDAGASIGEVWSNRWDSLTLFTPTQYDDLPGMPFPGSSDSYPGKEDVAAYLKSYAERFELPVRLNSAVRSLTIEDDDYVARTDNGVFVARQVVVATGPFQVPFVPAMAKDFADDLKQIHSADYRNPGSVPEGTILVVGGANTGCQIALELSETRQVVISVGKRLPTIPQRPLNRDVWWWGTRLGFTRVTAASRLGKRLSMRDVVIGGGLRELRKLGVRTLPRLTGAEGRTAIFDGGETVEVDGVLWATGYRMDHSWIDIAGAQDETGRLIQERGVSPVAGLYTLGLSWQHTRTSALLGWVTKDAEFIAGHIDSTAEEKSAFSASTAQLEGGTVAQSDSFDTDTAGLSHATHPVDLRLNDGDHLDLRIGPVKKLVGDGEVRMLAYNTSIPGPTLYVDQGSEITVEATNAADVDATVHWHGLRLENRYDGVPEETQAPIRTGESFTYKLQFPDAGLYWYHPHIREDYAQEMGLSGAIVVKPSDPSYWPPADRETTITLDDVLIEDGRMAPFMRSGPTFTAMGRFGNVMLTNGQTEFSEKVAVGEVVRLYFVNTANTRIFNVALPGARMKLLGGDSGRYEREEFIEEVMLAPSERAIVDVLFESEGEVRLEHRTPEQTYALGSFTVEGTTLSDAASEFSELRVDPELTGERSVIASDLEREPDKTLSFTSSMPLLYGVANAVATSYVCPMHPEVTDTEASACPKCGMKLIPADANDLSATPHEHDHGDTGDGLEWEDLMPDINRQTDRSNMIWKLVDGETGAVNHEIEWSFKVGDRVKIRLINVMEGSDHPMHHPFHVHGAGRFLILSRDGRIEPNLVWKDTVLLRAGETIDILLHITSPGLWMAHCHIAEHTESGMMFSFQVDP